MAITQTTWDGVSRFNIFAAGFCAGAASMYLLNHGDSLWFFGLLVFAALTNWHAAHIKPH